MIVPVGSLGDIVAVLQLGWKLRTILSEAAGASTEIHELLLDIDSFTRTLQHVKAAIEQRRTLLQPSVEHGIKHAIIAGHAVLSATLDKLAVFKTRMTSKVGAVAWRKYWAVTAWSILGGRKEVDSLRTRLAEQLGVVQTYLSLSHANDQSAVQMVVEQQGTTLNRVYSVIQDIQLRFDVGVPMFQFYNEDTGEYYQPFSRTSLTRWMQLMELAHKRQVARDVRRGDADPVIVLQTLDRNQTQCVMKHSLVFHEFRSSWMEAHLDCCYFRERAFGQWQVLIGFPYMPDPNSTRIFKQLVERRHAPNTKCNCDGPQCKVLLREDIKRAHYERDIGRTLHLLNQIAVLGLVMEADASRKHFQMCEEIFAELCLFPDGSYLRRTIIPLLALHVEHQRPSGKFIIGLLRDSPRSVIQLTLADMKKRIEPFLSWTLGPEWTSASTEAAHNIPEFFIDFDAAPVLSCYL